MEYCKRIVAPSILACDFLQIGEECLRAGNAGADWLHLDVMDGHFVPNISFGPAVVKAVEKATEKLVDVHLMIERPDRYLKDFLSAEPDIITIHVEAPHDVSETLKKIRAAGCLAGLALNPATDFQSALPYLDQIDLLLVMTVNPGFGGQSFIAETMPKVLQAAEERERRKLSYHVQVDGGITLETAKTAVQHGANVLVAGTAIFGSSDYARVIQQLREIPDRRF